MYGLDVLVGGCRLGRCMNGCVGRWVVFGWMCGWICR